MLCWLKPTRSGFVDDSHTLQSIRWTNWRGKSAKRLPGRDWPWMPITGWFSSWR